MHLSKLKETLQQNKPKVDEVLIEVLYCGVCHLYIHEEAMKAAELSLDFILCTIPYSFDVNTFVCLLKTHGNLITVGLLGTYKKPLDNMEAAKMNRGIGGSLIGRIAETQEVLDFCDAHQILPHVQLIDIANINDAFEKVKNEEVRFR